MKIASISLSIFEIPAVTRRFRLEEIAHPDGPKWRPVFEPRGREQIHVLHVMTEEGVEGVSTVGDARYARMRIEDLEQLRLLAIGEDALQRQKLWAKLSFATRHAFSPPGWAGAFDNCLWDIAGKAVGQPVWRLLGGAREAAPAYMNYFGARLEDALADAQRCWDQGWRVLKDHYSGEAPDNIAWLDATRARFPDAVLLHDAALCSYNYEEAVRVGRCLEANGYAWFEEPIADRRLADLKRLCGELSIPVAACETFMNDHALCAEWLEAGAIDILRGNARHGTTPLAGLAKLCKPRGTTLELNGPGGLFGLVHVHLCCGIEATTWYEAFPGGSRDAVGREIGLLNPPVPAPLMPPPSGPGWGAEWDRAWFEKVRLAVI